MKNRIESQLKRKRMIFIMLSKNSIIKKNIVGNKTSGRGSSDTKLPNQSGAPEHPTQ